MRAAVTGGRTYSDTATVYAALDAYKPVELAHGGAPGLDTLAGEWARQRGIQTTVYHANWRMDGPGAGPIRNRLMITDFMPDLLLAFPGGRGTDHCVSVARRLGVKIVFVGGELIVT